VSSGARATLVLPEGLPAGSRATVWWDAPSTTSVLLTVDEGRPVEVRRADGDTSPMARHVLTLEAGVRRVSVEPQGASPGFRLCGFTVERPDARVEVDALGLGGSVHLHPLRQQRGALQQYLRERKPDLVVVWYGSNSAPERTLDADVFARQYDQLLTMVESAAGGAMLLSLGLPDLARRSAACRSLPPSRVPTRSPKWRRRSRTTALPALDVRLASLTAGERESFAPVRRMKARDNGPVGVRGRAVLGRRVKHTRHAAKPSAKLTRAAQRSRRRMRRFPPLVCSPDPAAPPLSPPAQSACLPRTLPSVPLIRDAERRVARAHGAAFFDLYALMGEADGMLRWHCLRPSLALSDMVHLSAAGYTHVAAVLAETLRGAADRLPDAGPPDAEPPDAGPGSRDETMGRAGDASTR
jgi:lysophospholipase L1-like esterase